MSSSVAFHTLGCKLNYSETSTLNQILEKEGFTTKKFDQPADVYVINTCSVTENADKECKQLVRRVQRQNPEATIVITGCYAQLKPTQISQIKGVDLVLGAAEKFNIVQHLKTITQKQQTAKIYSCDIADVNTFTAAYSTGQRTRAFLKVQDGCDYSCTFCTIPLARGKSRSDTIPNVLNNIHQLAQQGTKEIVLTGVNIGDFGKGHTSQTKTKQETFLELIQAIDNTPNIPRYRISSIEPNLLTPEIISFVKSSKHFMPHFHIPLQSGSNTMLALMRRRYQQELYTQRIHWIQQEIPHASIGVDVIVGFPGETDEHFLETYNYLNSLPIAYLHVFTYSERPNTPAIDLPNPVPIATRQLRNKALRNLSYKKTTEFQNKYANTTRPVLFEKNSKNNQLEGYTDNYIKVSRPYNPNWENTIIDVTL